ncbi:Nucleolar complex protein 4-like protein B [Hypsibius exemplaris]|uniref:Nucleolar complex protein 4-like protein B n=1 Tax=Hypsibius exemplaris TaxID=2072580 RepID=A0A1W0XCT7_HYPEX|nr:Nucleolar complex protein 4-like protein B [Hypsibius exemplaris]
MDAANQVAEEIPEELLKSLPIPYDGSLVSFFRSLKQFLPQQHKFVEENEEYQLRLLEFLHAVKLGPRQKGAKRGAKRALHSDVPKEKTAQELTDNNELELRGQYAQVVLEVLKCELTRKTYIKFLLHVHDRIIPNMSKPLLLADFLISSFRRGGLLSVLALNGLFSLIQEHHLDFPQFYEKFYALLTPEVLTAKYRARFFYLADLFMSSSHIPQYTVAAVAKRLSRLSLTAPADSLPLLLTFIFNLIIRHPSLLALIHRTDSEDILVDPYVLSDPDMQTCRALDSSLWELKSLKSHYNEEVVKYALTLEDKLPTTEFDITEHLETDTQEMIDAVLGKELPENQPVKGSTSTALFAVKSSCFGALWDLS